ncbi:hypothetical protein [Nitrosomonas sp.]|uniref:hypothetical protein n=1 Tax=Nitrosomonas sp. TaxID=42353 RepID=UPI00283F425D|nr:hypothetical protein [Nitrosomonas sp.]MDR4513158.1 hypothetical protein [Nitrosomonas sp.]
MIQGMVKEIIASIVAAGIVAFAGYLFIVKENQLMIRNLSDDLTNIKNEIEKSNSALRATNLFIAQAHPDRDVSMLASMKKLQEFNKQEIKILAESLPEIQVTTSNNKKIKSRIFRNLSNNLQINII